MRRQKKPLLPERQKRFFCYRYYTVLFRGSDVYAAVDAETKVFCCGSCGAWETGKDLTLWAPDDPAAISRKRYGEKTAEEWGCVPYVSRRTLEEEYPVVKRRYRKCPRCGHRMHRASEEELQRLPCPDCGEPNAPQGEILWD